MAMINSILAAIGAGLAGFFGHLLAHDFAVMVPNLARGLIAIAVQKLPASQRQRYAEEWLAHLNEREGIFSKLMHGIGCVISIRRLNREYRRQAGQEEILRLQFAGLGVAECNLATMMVVKATIQYLVHAYDHRWMRQPIVWRTYANVTSWWYRRKHGPADYGKALHVLSLIRQSPVEDWSAWINGEPIDDLKGNA